MIIADGLKIAVLNKLKSVKMEGGDLISPKFGKSGKHLGGIHTRSQRLKGVSQAKPEEYFKGTLVFSCV